MVGVACGAEGTYIRPYRVEDQDAVDGLLDADSDPLWVGQGHQLHGEATGGERWRRTWVAEIAGRVVGAVTVARNRVHPGRYSLAVEVGADARGQGIGRRLVEHARREAPEPLPLAAKLRPSQQAGVALLHRFGGRVYQHCPGLCPDPSATAVLTWAGGVEPRAGAMVRPLADVPRRDWADLWVRQYLWVHQDWSPAAEGPLRELAHSLANEADSDLTSVVVGDSGVNAVTWVFDGRDGTAEIVAETVERHATEGVADVACSLTRSLRKLARAGVRKAEIDGHASDPHLQPVVHDLPKVPREPLDLVEISARNGQQRGNGRP